MLLADTTQRLSSFCAPSFFHHRSINVAGGHARSTHSPHTEAIISIAFLET